MTLVLAVAWANARFSPRITISLLIWSSFQKTELHFLSICFLSAALDQFLITSTRFVTTPWASCVACPGVPWILYRLQMNNRCSMAFSGTIMSFMYYTHITLTRILSLRAMDRTSQNVRQDSLDSWQDGTSCSRTPADVYLLSVPRSWTPDSVPV